MEPKSVQCLVRDLDLTLQPRIAPRYKTWLPLATQQLRLRSLVRVIGYNLEVDRKHETCWFYYTLHRSSMSSPLYTSKAVDNASARWASLEVPTLHATGLSAASEIVLRLWRRTVSKDPTTDVTVFTWGISFTGLAYMGPKLPTNLETILRDNSLIFHLHGGYFAPSYCLISPPDLKRYLYMNITPSEIRESYTVVKLTSLRSKMQALKQQTESVQTLRERIASGDEVRSPKYKQNSLNRLLQPKKISREKKAEILRIRKELEIAKFRTKLLEQERVRKMGELRTLNQLRTSIMEENQDHGRESEIVPGYVKSKLNCLYAYRELNKDIERLREWRQSHLESREGYIQTTSNLAHRRRQLISELCLIYPISQENEKKFTINNVHLPDSEDLDASNDTQVAVALGFVAHTTQMIANFLNVPTRYPILHYGSRSRIVDHITDSLPDNERQFPLFARSKDKLQFHYAVYLLNKNIAQLRWYCGLPTFDLRTTLPNLASLMINIKPNQPLDGSKRTFSGSSLDTDMGNGKQAPLTPPIHKVMFEKCPRTPRSMSQLRSVKSGLCSSLDQGLDKPPQSQILSNKSKRIYKSEESAIDEKHLSLPREKGSDETLNDTVFDNSDPRVGKRAYQLLAELHDMAIEILTPVSISKPKNVSDTTDDSDSAKQRSSNSVSSCEMALSGSQNDIIGSPNDSGASGVNFTNGDCVSLGDDVKAAEHRVASVVNEPDSKSVSSNGSSANPCGSYERDKSQETLTEVGQKDSSVVSKNSVHSEDTLSNSCASLDDKPSSNYERKDEKTMIGSASSYPDNYNSGMAGLMLRGYESDGRSDKQGARNRLDANCRAESSTNSEGPSEYSQLLDEKPQTSKSLSNAQANKDQEATSEFRASSDYIDSIRRSSENVFARTEALASKKTSFKVMKPRM